MTQYTVMNILESNKSVLKSLGLIFMPNDKYY